jgi:outer membrane murein-binding lipoprotein Lpp
VLAVDKTRNISISLAVVLAILAALLSGGAVYFWQQELLQSSLQVKIAEIEELNREVTGLKAKIDELENDLQNLAPQTPTPAGSEKRIIIQEKADKILLALKNKDLAEVSKYVHPQKGLRFSPYTYIDTAKDLVFPGADLPGLFSSTTVYNWGKYDGSGQPIQLTFSDYYARFIYDNNFLAAPQIFFNQVFQRGNMINNITMAYPQGAVLEYHFPGFVQQYEGMDWESLKLVFEQAGTTWYLVGIIHEQWTI